MSTLSTSPPDVVRTHSVRRSLGSLPILVYSFLVKSVSSTSVTLLLSVDGIEKVKVLIPFSWGDRHKSSIPMGPKWLLTIPSDMDLTKVDVSRGHTLKGDRCVVDLSLCLSSILRSSFIYPYLGVGHLNRNRDRCKF